MWELVETNDQKRYLLLRIKPIIFQLSAETYTKVKIYQFFMRKLPPRWPIISRTTIMMIYNFSTIG